MSTLTGEAFFTEKTSLFHPSIWHSFHCQCNMMTCENCIVLGQKMENLGQNLTMYSYWSKMCIFKSIAYSLLVFTKRTVTVNLHLFKSREIQNSSHTWSPKSRYSKLYSEHQSVIIWDSNTYLPNNDVVVWVLLGEERCVPTLAITKTNST